MKQTPALGRLAVSKIAIVGGLCVIMILPGIDAPFSSAGHERQNQTYDTASHIFREGWGAFFAPKVSFSTEANLQQPFTVVRFEVPLQGLVAWPLVSLGVGDRIAMRSVSVCIALISIWLAYRVIRWFLDDTSALAGAALWAFSPMVLHFGSVPMPDILCTTGMIAAFYYSLKKDLALSSLAFSLALLAKPSIIVFGLPILTALLVAQEVRSMRRAILLSVFWGLLPLAGLLGWAALGLSDPQGSWNLLLAAKERHFRDLATLKLYFRAASYLIPFGVGIIGAISLAFAMMRTAGGINWWVKMAVIGASLCCYIFMPVYMWREPQYSLPVLFWIVLAASFGFRPILDKLKTAKGWRVAAYAALILHVLIAGTLFLDLRSSRLDWEECEKAATYLPMEARILLVSWSYGASPAVLLGRNVIHADPGELTKPDTIELYTRSGFTHLLLLDLTIRGNPLSRKRIWSNFAAQDSATRLDFSKKLKQIYAGEHTALFALPGEHIPVP